VKKKRYGKAFADRFHRDLLQIIDIGTMEMPFGKAARRYLLPIPF